MSDVVCYFSRLLQILIGLINANIFAPMVTASLVLLKACHLSDYQNLTVALILRSAFVYSQIQNHFYCVCNV